MSTYLFIYLNILLETFVHMWEDSSGLDFQKWCFCVRVALSLNKAMVMYTPFLTANFLFPQVNFEGTLCVWACGKQLIRTCGFTMKEFESVMTNLKHRVSYQLKSQIFIECLCSKYFGAHVGQMLSSEGTWAAKQISKLYSMLKGGKCYGEKQKKRTGKWRSGMLGRQSISNKMFWDEKYI